MSKSEQQHIDGDVLKLVDRTLERHGEIIKLAEEVFKQYDKTLKDLVKR